MGFRFRKSLRIAPGVRLNLSPSGVSTSVGPRGASVTFSRRGTYANLGLPGTGMSWRGRIDGGHGRSEKLRQKKPSDLATKTFASATPAETAGETALASALSHARMRRPYCNGLVEPQETSVPSNPHPAQANLLLEGRIDRSQFLVGSIGLSGSLFFLAWLRDTYPSDFSADGFLLGMLVLAAVAAFLVACRSRSAGFPPVLALVSMGAAAWLMPTLLPLMLLALLVAPKRQSR